MSLCAGVHSWSFRTALSENFVWASSGTGSLWTPVSPAGSERSQWAHTTSSSHKSPSSTAQDFICLFIVNSPAKTHQIDQNQTFCITCYFCFNSNTKEFLHYPHFFFLAFRCSQATNSHRAGSGLVHLWCGVAAWCWYLTGVHVPVPAPQRHSALEIPNRAHPPFQSVLETAERTWSQNPTGSAASGGSCLF